MRSNEDAVEMIEKAKDLLESACEMLKNAMDERNGMNYRNQMRDSRGRYSGRDWDRDERMMRRDDMDDMPRGRYGY
jgi:hypothetical protein